MVAGDRTGPAESKDAADMAGGDQTGSSDSYAGRVPAEVEGDQLEPFDGCRRGRVAHERRQRRTLTGGLLRSGRHRPKPI